MQQKSSKRSDYWPTIKKFFSNWPFIIIFLFVGGAMGYISTISTKIEQILCSSGYSDQLAGKILGHIFSTGVKILNPGSCDMSQKLRQTKCLLFKI